MPCTGRYAEAWEFVAFWFTGVVWLSADRSGGAGNVSLFDSQVNFRERGTIANTGQWLWNLTKSTEGPITAVVDNNTITAADIPAWDDGDSYRISLVTTIERGQIEIAMDKAASDVHVALAATAQCDCTWANWALNYASKLNIIDTASYYQGKCGSPRFKDAQRMEYLRWMSQELDKLSAGVTDLCAGATGSNFPVVGWAQQASTPFATAGIIWKDILRNG